MDEDTLTGDQIANAGRALYGQERWLSDLSRETGIGDRNLRRILSGADRPPTWLRKMLVTMLENRQAAVAAALAQLAMPSNSILSNITDGGTRTMHPTPTASETTMTRSTGARAAPPRPARHRLPTHPGEVLRQDSIPATGMTVAAVAKALRVSRQHLHLVLNGERSVTADLAVRLGRFFGNGPNLWINMQVAYDLAVAERELAADLATIPTLAGCGGTPAAARTLPPVRRLPRAVLDTRANRVR